MRWCEADTANSIPQRFDEVARLHPDRIAIAADPRPLSYLELGRLSDRWARALPRFDHRTGELAPRAALLLSHGAAAITGALAALKSGFTVIALNPSDPPTRHAQIRAGVQPAVLLCEEAHLERGRAAGFGERETIVFSAIPENASPERQQRWPDPEELAFLISTSGSTGRPKIVMQSHRNILHNVLRYTNGLAIGADDRIAWLTSLSGGQGLATAWTALLNGATLCPWWLTDRGMIGLRDWMVANGVTVFDTLPSVLRNFSRTLGSERVPGIRIVRLASEAGLRTDFDAFRYHFPRESVLASVLASSETGILSNAILRHEDELTTGNLSVGAEVEGIRLLLLDQAGHEVGDGESGEIVVVSPYLSPGYWGDEKLTAERFQGHGSTRRFRTGDVGRRSPSGPLTVLGRIDSQVKVRGHRLQLEEVEEALAAQPGVAGAAAAVRVTSRGDTMLVGYVMVADGRTLDAEGLRRALGTVLPPHAVPASLVHVDDLPLTANGKVDRARLPEPESAGTLPAPADADEPRDDVERALLEIWEELLDHRPIGLAESFFSIGGDSLGVMEMLVAIEQRLDCSLTPGALLDAQTIQSLAELIRDPSRSGSETQVRTIGSDSSRPPLILAYSVSGKSLDYRHLANALGGEFPLHLLEAPWWNGKPNQFRTLEQLAALHVAQIQELGVSGPYLLGGYSFGGVLALEMARQLEAAGHEIALLVPLDTYIGVPTELRYDPQYFPGAPKNWLGRWRLVSRWIERHRFWTLRGNGRWPYVETLLEDLGYRYPLQPYDGQVTLIRCTRESRPPEDRGWGSVARGGLEIHDLACTHHEPLGPPFVDELASILAELVRASYAQLASRSRSREPGPRPPSLAHRPAPAPPHDPGSVGQPDGGVP